jgi:hypothetical protein
MNVAVGKDRIVVANGQGVSTASSAPSAPAASTSASSGSTNPAFRTVVRSVYSGVTIGLGGNVVRRSNVDVSSTTNAKVASLTRMSAEGTNAPRATVPGLSVAAL